MGCDFVIPGLSERVAGNARCIYVWFNRASIWRGLGLGWWRGWTDAAYWKFHLNDALKLSFLGLPVDLEAVIQSYHAVQARYKFVVVFAAY